MHHVIALLDAAIGQLHEEQVAHGTLLEATSLLRRQVDPQPAQEGVDDGKERLLAWQARKVLEHIDKHIASRVLVADLCALVRRSEAHFSRSFRHTFGYSPHAFVVRRRVELAARSMLQTDTSLSEIALQCGFADQAHLCKHFRQLTGETPAAWRRARRARGADIEGVSEPGEGVPGEGVVLPTCLEELPPEQHRELAALSKNASGNSNPTLGEPDRVIFVDLEAIKDQ